MRTIRTLRNGAHVKAEANGIVLAVNNKGEWVTWLVGFDPQEVSCGHYYNDEVGQVEALECFFARAYTN